MATNLLSLPNEILEDVLRYAAQPELKNIFTVSKRLNAIAEPIWYEDITVDLTDVETKDKSRWIQRISSSIAFEKVQTFALYMPCHGCYSSNKDLPNLTPTYLSLSDMLSKMRKLGSFELMGEPLDGHNRMGKWGQNTPARLNVQSLLRPVVNLQMLHNFHLDITGEYDLKFNEIPNRGSHLCHLVNKIILQVPNSRVRLPTMCSKILLPPQAQDGQLQSRIRNICINFHHQPSEENPNYVYSSLECQKISMSRTRLEFGDMAEEALTLVAVVPGIESLQIMGPEGPFYRFPPSVAIKDYVSGLEADADSTDWVVPDGFTIREELRVPKPDN